MVLPMVQGTLDEKVSNKQGLKVSMKLLWHFPKIIISNITEHGRNRTRSAGVIIVTLQWCKDYCDKSLIAIQNVAAYN